MILHGLSTVALALFVPSPPPEAQLALGGLDPVLLCQGSEVAGLDGVSAEHGRYLYRFADAESRERFLVDPERWAIQWGGGCGQMGPLSGLGSPDRFAVHDGRIFIFASDGCRAGFLSAPERFVVPPPKLPPVSEEASAAGAAWIERAVAAHGAAAVDRARALRLAVQGPAHGWHRRVEQVLAWSGEHSRRITWTPREEGDGVRDTRWVVGDDPFVDETGDVVSLTSPDRIADLTRFAHRQPIALLWARHREDSLVLHTGRSELGGRPVENVLIYTAGLATTLHLDPASARVRGLSWRGRADDGMTRDVIEQLTEWRDVDGVLVAVRRRVLVDGEENEALAGEWREVEILEEVPHATFVRPGR